MDEPPANLSPVEAPDRAHDESPASPARNGSTGSPGSPDAPQIANGYEHGNGNGAGEGEAEADGHIRYTLAAWALVSYGTVQRLAHRQSSDGHALPVGESRPPAHYWLRRYLTAPREDRPLVANQAAAELGAWRRRAPELNEIKTETLDDLKRRILRDGEGWTAKDVALAMRCTPTLVRNVRTEAERSPDDGRPEGSLQHARELHAQGLSLRQIAVLTGIPKSTLHDALR